MSQILLTEAHLAVLRKLANDPSPGPALNLNSDEARLADDFDSLLGLGGVVSAEGRDLLARIDSTPKPRDIPYVD